MEGMGVTCPWSANLPFHNHAHIIHHFLDRLDQGIFSEACLSKIFPEWLE
jgi:hypothetical protein